MRTFIGFMMIAFWPVMAQQRLSTEIKEVTVYSDRAEIVRKGEAYLSGGDVELIVKDLPYSLQDISLRVGGSGTASAKISDIKIELEYIDTMPKNRLKEFRDDLDVLLLDERVITDRLTVLTKEKELLELIKVNATSPSKDAAKVAFEDWAKLFAFYDLNLNKLNEEIRGLERKKSESANRKTNLQNQINQLSGYGRLTKKKVSIKVSAATAGTMNFSISYVIANAKWYPVYDVRVSPEDKAVEMVYYAMIAQATGEDWKNVQLSISTARPNVSGVFPQLSAWYLNVAQPVYSTRSAKAKKSAESYSGNDEMRSVLGAGAGSASMSLGEALEEEKINLGSDEAVVETRSTSVVFNIPKSAVIPADNYDHKVVIGTQKLKADFRYNSTPKLAASAFLGATIENTTDLPFLAGNANVFFGSDFVGQTYLKTVISGEKFDVSLGVDDGIRVKREQVRDYSSEKGLFSKSNKKVFEYKITIESFKKTEEPITITDQYPVSNDERIKVEFLTPEFAKEKYQSEIPNGVVEKKGNGLVEWKLKMKPKEKIELRIKYTIEYPQGLQIDGM